MYIYYTMFFLKLFCIIFRLWFFLWMKIKQGEHFSCHFQTLPISNLKKQMPLYCIENLQKSMSLPQVTLFLLHFFCYSFSVTLFILHFFFYTFSITLFLLHFFCYTFSVTLFLLHFFYYTFSVTLLSLSFSLTLSL